MSKRGENSEDQVIEWARRIAEQWEHSGNELYPHFLQLLKEYKHLLYSFNRVTRVSDGYQKSLMETNEYLNRAARKDALTGISNRRNMLDLLSEEVKRANRYDHPVSTILIDIDHFKKVNDTYGHGVGDKVLVEVARTLGGGLRDTDTVARWGGEEFLISLPHTGIEDAVKVADKLRLAVSGDSVVEGEERIHITISAGVAEYEVGTTVENLISLADRALYEAKEQGRNRVCRAR